MTIIAFLWSLMGCLALFGNEPGIRATADDKKIQLTILLPTEPSVQKCFVERSSNGKRFFVLDQLPRPEPVPDSVVFSDYHPLYINYYRIKMRIADGTTAYSKAVMVKNSAAMDASIFYNSSHKMLEVQLKNGLKAFCHVYNMNGDKVKSASLKRETNSINISALPIGNYYVQVVTSKDQSFGKTLLIQ